jgi:hypothetical protein
MHHSQIECPPPTSCFPPLSFLCTFIAIELSVIKLVFICIIRCVTCDPCDGARL